MNKNLLIKYRKIFEKASLLDNYKFRMLCSSKEAIEEMLSVIIMEKVKIIEIIKQSSEELPIFHGVILDCKCMLSTKEIVNIEVQLSQNDNVIYRMRYNSSILTVENSSKNKNFKYRDIPKIIQIMICDFDLFKKGKTIYEIKRIVKGTKVEADNGIREIYVNMKSKAKSKKLRSFIKIMTTVDETDEKEFPIISQKKREINKLYIGGEENMQGLDLIMYKDGLKAGRAAGLQAGRKAGMQAGMRAGRVAGMKEGERKGKISSIVELFNNKVITISQAISALNVSESEFYKLLKQY